MITEFSINNFKSFSSTQIMKFAPITLIYGPNSSGKSSIIQALMMLRQTLGKDNAGGMLQIEGDSISLGTYNSIVHGKDESLGLGFGFKYKTNHDAQDFRVRHSYNMPFANSDLRASEFFYDKVKNKVVLKNFSFEIDGKVRFCVRRGHETSDGYLYTLDADNSLRKAIVRSNQILPTDGKLYGELDDSLSKPFKIDNKFNLPKSVSVLSSSNLLSNYTGQVLDDLSYLLNRTKYLGPLRSSPKRFYSSEISIYQKGQGKGNLGFDLHNASEKTKSKVNEYLFQFNIPYEISTDNLGRVNTGDIIEIKLKDLRNNAVVTPKDVGFGIGQVLPIILDGIVSERTLICVEQPEIHLHPRLQAHLADLFIDSIVSDNQWVIETHSEALMLRIQRRIREKLISKEMVSVLYVDVGDNGAQVISLPLDDDGDFTRHWPDGFFEERLEEIFGARQ